MIQLQAITRHYQLRGQTVSALRGVDLHIASGEFVAITGASGSGKSTLLNVLGCLDRPSSGQYCLEGREVGSLDDEAISDVRNHRIGFVFQSFHLLTRLSVLENVMLPMRFSRAQDANAEARAKKLLARVGLGDRLDHRPGELSGGQMQRAAIARALLMQPALLLADEPTGNLDSKTAVEVIELLRELHTGGQTVVLVTHDLDIAASANRSVRLRDGKVESDVAQ
jgi:putative ABC transport system ATP-binding protein